MHLKDPFQVMPQETRVQAMLQELPYTLSVPQKAIIVDTASLGDVDETPLSIEDKILKDRESYSIKPARSGRSDAGSCGKEAGMAQVHKSTLMSTRHSRSTRPPKKESWRSSKATPYDKHRGEQHSNVKRAVAAATERKPLQAHERMMPRKSRQPFVGPAAPVRVVEQAEYSIPLPKVLYAILTSLVCLFALTAVQMAPGAHAMVSVVAKQGNGVLQSSPFIPTGKGYFPGIEMPTSVLGRTEFDGTSRVPFFNSSGTGLVLEAGDPLITVKIPSEILPLNAQTYSLHGDKLDDFDQESAKATLSYMGYPVDEASVPPPESSGATSGDGFPGARSSSNSIPSNVARARDVAENLQVYAPSQVPEGSDAAASLRHMRSVDNCAVAVPSDGMGRAISSSKQHCQEPETLSDSAFNIAIPSGLAAGGSYAQNTQVLGPIYHEGVASSLQEGGNASNSTDTPRSMAIEKPSYTFETQDSKPGTASKRILQMGTHGDGNATVTRSAPLGECLGTNVSATSTLDSFSDVQEAREQPGTIRPKVDLGSQKPTSEGYASLGLGEVPKASESGSKISKGENDEVKRGQTTLLRRILHALQLTNEQGDQESKEFMSMHREAQQGQQAEAMGGFRNPQPKQHARTKSDAQRERAAGIGKKSRPLNPKFSGSVHVCRPTEDCESEEEFFDCYQRTREDCLVEPTCCELRRTSVRQLRNRRGGVYRGDSGIYHYDPGRFQQQARQANDASMQSLNYSAEIASGGTPNSATEPSSKESGMESRAIYPHETKVPPVKHNATLTDWLSGKYSIQSFDPTIWEDSRVIPVVIMCSGIGGVEQGIAEYQELLQERGIDRYFVTALAIDASADACQAHRLNHSRVPVVEHECRVWKSTQDLISKYLPRKYWNRMWMHTSNSCKEASTVNFHKRDPRHAAEITWWFIRCMQRCEPAIWTLENVTALHRHFEGQFPTARVFKMNQHCRLPQGRNRMILCSKHVELKREESERLTFYDALGDALGLQDGQQYFQQNSFLRHKTVHSPAFTVTGGQHRAGAKTVGELSPEYNLTSAHRAILQGYGGVRFPKDMKEQARRDMIAQIVPPPFAAVMAEAVDEALEKTRDAKQLQDELRYLSYAPPSIMDEINKTMQRHEQDPQPLAHNLGKHGIWRYYGTVFGWCRDDMVHGMRFRELLEKPWMVIPLPPRKDQTLAEWHVAEAARSAESARTWNEKADMDAEDTRSHEPPRRKTYSQKLYNNVHQDPECRAIRDSNKLLQESDPENYGPYLDEGERYHTPRTAENVAKACKDMGIDDFVGDKEGEKEFYKKMVYDKWILFDGKLRAVKGVLIDIDTHGIPPIHLHPYSWNPSKTEYGKKLIDSFCKDEICSPAVSNWSFPASMVPKPNNETEKRLVVDLRELNTSIPLDRYESPNCELCLQWLQQRENFSVFDLRWGFHQIAVTDETKKVFTFTTPIGTFCYNRLLMGFKNAMPIFQRVCNYTMGDSLWRECILMVDDGVVGSSTLEEHRVHMETCLSKLAARHHSIKPSKMSILPDSIKYLGHKVTREGTAPNDDHVKAVKEMPPPLDNSGMADITKVRSAIGLFKYLRRYIKDCGKLCGVLNSLVLLDSDRIWKPEHQEAFDKLKAAVVDSVGVYTINFNQPIFMCTDGSKDGLGGYIYQVIEGKERICSYWSRSTTKAEKKWDTRELEVLAIICTLEHFGPLIDGSHLTLQTDHKNLKWLMDMKDPGGRLGRWVLRLQGHSFEIEYRAGKYNEVADSLSRLPLAPGNEVPDLANFTRDDSENSVSRDFVVTKTETSGHYQIQLGNGPEEHREVLPSAEEGADVTDSILGHDGGNSSHLQRRELMGLKQSSTEFSTQVQQEREASSLLTRLKELVMGKQETAQPAEQEPEAKSEPRIIFSAEAKEAYARLTEYEDDEYSTCELRTIPRSATFAVHTQVSPDREHNNKVFGKGSRARLRVRPKGKAYGFIVQRIYSHGRIGDREEVATYTEAWRTAGDRVEQQGDDDFMIPHSWLQEAAGTRVIDADSWFQPKLDSEFYSSDSSECQWGRLKGTHVYKAPPVGAKVLRRHWEAKWDDDGNVTYTSKNKYLQVPEPRASGADPTGDAQALEEHSDATLSVAEAEELKALSCYDDGDGEGRGQLFSSDTEVDPEEYISKSEPPALPMSMLPVLLTFEDIKTSQARDGECEQLRERIEQDVASTGVGRHYDILGDVIYRVVRADDPSGPGHDSMRPFLPEALRPMALMNAHGSGESGHVHATATFKELSRHYFWPQMEKDVAKHIRECELCQLAKGTKPHRQGLHMGHRYVGPLHSISMDLIGPIHTASSGAGKRVPLYVWVACDPATHMVWLEPIYNKSAESVYAAIVNRLLLEEGRFAVVLTDNGSEFRNSLLNDAFRLLSTRRRFTPAFHPRGNETERVNRFIGEQLRVLLNEPGVVKSDWYRYIKLVEFTMRRLPIPGTNYSAFQVARGRQPSTINDLGVQVPRGSAYTSLQEQVRELAEQMMHAEQVVKDARAKAQATAKFTWDSKHILTDFEKGSLVRFWNRLVGRKGEEPSKLMLRNAVYEVVDQQGSLVSLKNRDTGALRDAHLSQIARFYEASAPRPTPPALTVVTPPERDDLWDKITVGNMVAYWIKGEPAGHIRLGEVLELDEDDRQLAVWYYIHGGVQAHKFNPARPLGEIKAVPEWYNQRNQVVLNPKDTSRLEKRVALVTDDEVELIASNFQLVRGKVPAAVIQQADAWLRRMAAVDKSAYDSISDGNWQAAQLLEAQEPEEPMRVMVMEQALSSLEEIGILEQHIVMDFRHLNYDTPAPAVKSRAAYVNELGKQPDIETAEGFGSKSTRRGEE